MNTNKAHHMPEEYYEKWGKLRKAERRAWREAQQLAHSCVAWAKYERAAKRLTAHEMKHDTR